MEDTGLPVDKINFVYLLTFPNGKAYCGITNKIPERRWQNGEGYQKCPLVYKAIKKYGWDNITKTIIYSTPIREEAYQKEKEVISENQLTNPQFGYNLHEGGKPTGSGKFLTKEGRNKISEANRNRVITNETKEKLRQINLGKKLSEETKRKISESKKGQLPPNVKAVYQLDLNGNIIAEYISASEAARAINAVQGCSNILRACKDINKQAYGFRWKLVNCE